MITTNVYMHAGKTSKHTERFIPVSDIAAALGQPVCCNLPAAHALTGCDSTSSLYKVGKNIAYTNLLKLVVTVPQSFADFGVSGDDRKDTDSARSTSYCFMGNTNVPILMNCCFSLLQPHIG